MDNNVIMIVVVVAVLAVAFLLLRGRDSAEAQAPAEAPAAPAAPAASAAPVPAPGPQVEAGIPPEVVAAIAAAVYAMGNGKYVLRAVRRADRSAWARAGAADVTAPF